MKNSPSAIASREWARRNSKKIKAKRREYITNGICGACQKEPLEIGKAACRTCLDKSHVISRKIYKRIKETKDEKKSKLIELLGGKCSDCNYAGHIAGFEFDHLGDKKYNISDMLNQACRWERILEEVAKCELVCATCHRIRTYKRRRL